MVTRARISRFTKHPCSRRFRLRRVRSVAAAGFVRTIGGAAPSDSDPVGPWSVTVLAPACMWDKPVLTVSGDVGGRFLYRT
jgi:hypothetical protein